MDFLANPVLSLSSCTCSSAKWMGKKI